MEIGKRWELANNCLSGTLSRRRRMPLTGYLALSIGEHRGCVNRFGLSGFQMIPHESAYRLRPNRQRCPSNPQRRPNMNWDQVKGNWKQMTGKIKAKWGKLTDDDLTVIAGKRDELAGKLQERYGYAKEQAEKELDDFTRTLGP